MLVLTRKSQESVMVGGVNEIEHLLKVTVLEIKRGGVRLGFEASQTLAIHRWEVWEQIRGNGRCNRPVEGPTAK